MKKVMFFVLLVALIIPVFSIEVDKKELQSAENTDSIVFINYTGPYSVINTIEQIKGIGRDLSPAVNSDSIETPGSFGNPQLYYVIHAVDSNIKEKLDADILILGEKSSVDHIKNLRRIISAYLESAYGYSQTDADTLSVFITVYNAVYRSKMDIFTAKYKTVVTKHLVSEKAGLSVNYEDWPGKTQIIIPLSTLDGGLSSIDTSVISDKEVVESMRDTEDKEIDARKDLVDIKEREAEIASDAAQDAQKEATDAQKTADEAKAKAKAEEEKLKAAEAEAAKAEEKAKENPDDKAAQEDAQEKNEAVKEQEVKTEVQTKKAEEAKTEAEKLKTTATEEQVIADKKTAEAQADRIGIAKDQQELLTLADLLSVMKTTHGLKLIDQEDLLSALVLFDVETGAVVKESPVNVIRNRQVLKSDEGFIAIAGKTSGNAAVKLVILDNRSMEIIKESAEKISEKSILAYTPSFIFVVMQSDNGWYLGRYNYDLTLSLKSEIQVQEATPIVVSDSGIGVTSIDGNVVLLDPDTLKVVN